MPSKEARILAALERGEELYALTLDAILKLVVEVKALADEVRAIPFRTSTVKPFREYPRAPARRKEEPAQE